MDTLKSAIGLCAKIYEMHGTFQSNQSKCNWLLDLVSTIMRSLTLQSARNAVPVELEEPLTSLHQQLESSVSVLDEYGRCGFFRKFLFGASQREAFEESGHRLTSCHSAFSHAVSLQLATDQRDQQQQMDARLRNIQALLEHASQSDAEQHRQDLLRAMQSAHLLETLRRLGISPDELHSGSSSSASFSVQARSIATFEDAKNCGWFIRSETVSFDKKEVGRSRELQNVRLGKSGSFGDVYSAIYCNDTPVAVKKLKSPISDRDLASSETARASFASFVTEVSFAVSLKHPNIVRTFGGVVDALEDPPCWIVMERLDVSLAEVRGTCFAVPQIVQVLTRIFRSQSMLARDLQFMTTLNCKLSWVYVALSSTCTHPDATPIRNFLTPTPTVTSSPKTLCTKMALPS
jgi:hypothetical protein